MDYRKFYQETTNIELPNNFDVHHIDFNRDNNEIENLVALPSNIHILFHKSYYSIPIDLKIDSYMLNPKSITEQGYASFECLMDNLNKYFDIYKEVLKWVFYRDFLLNKIPNLYNKKY